MPSWWGKSSSKEVKKSKESLIDTLQRKLRTTDGKTNSKSGESPRHCNDTISEQGSRSPILSRSVSPSKQVLRCQSFSERPQAQPLPLPGVQPPIVGRTDSGISISPKPRSERGSKPTSPGASRIIGVDLNPARFEEAKKFGCNEFVNPKDHSKPVQEVIAEMTNGGVDRSVECTGSIQAMIAAFECVHDGWGVAVLVGVPNKDDAFKTHPMNLLNERTLKGTFFGNYKPRSDIPGVVEKYLNKELELEKFITHTVSFSEINKAFEYMLKGESIRCIIKMDN